MRRFLTGAMVTIVIIAAAVLVWYELDDQAQGVVVGILLGAGGIVAGVLLALAAVAIFLLVNLRWSVNQGAKPPIILPGTRPALPAPPQQQWYSPRHRAPRRWSHILGGEDVEDVDQMH